MTSKRRPGRTHKTGVPLVSRNSPRPAARHLSDIGPPGPGAHRKVSRRDDPPRVRTGKHAAVPEPGRAIAHRRILPTRIVVGLAVLATGTPIATAWAIDVARPAFVESSLARQRITSPAVPEQAVTSGQGAIPQEEDAAVSEPSTPSPEPSPPTETPEADLPVPRKNRSPRTVRVPEQGSGEFRVVPSARANLTSAELLGTRSFRIEVEGGLPIKGAQFADSVVRTLSDPRSWAGRGSADPLTRSDGEATFRIVLASPDATDRLCAPLDTGGRVSCRNGDDVVINAWRWVNGADSYEGEMRAYRRYVVNHEVGHALGNPHALCPGPGQAAPVMVQQTYGLDGCTANPWPQGTDTHG